MRPVPKISARVFAGLALLAGLAACAQAPTDDERAQAGAQLEQLARAPARAHLLDDHDPARLTSAPLATDDAAGVAAKLVPWLARAPAVAAQAAFDLGTSGAANAAELIEAHLPANAPAEVVAAAAMGLTVSKSPATERVLLALALRPSHPPEALEALFAFYRGRGAANLPPATLPDAQLLAFVRAPSARSRAAFCQLARAIKDPALVGPLTQLGATDVDFEVRRAAVLALGEGPAKRKRDDAARASCLAGIAPRFGDADTHVVIAACRAAATYDDPRAVELLTAALGHADFNVRVAALEGLGLRKAKSATAAMTRLARGDPSVSVRYAAATQLVKIDADAALTLADSLLADANEYVRTAGVEVLATSSAAGALTRLALLAKSDPHVRVRETAVGAFEDKTGPVAREAIRLALADADPVVVSTACGVVAKNKWNDLAAELAAIPARFPDCRGADARGGALEALAALEGGPAQRPLFAAHLHDPNPEVRATAAKAIATFDKTDPPASPSRGADLTGTLFPGGVLIFGPDVFLLVETDRGPMKIRLFPDQAPVHCAHVAALARAGFYDGLTWHRVVPDFVIQGGCPRGDGSGNAGVSLPLEPTRIPFQRGTLGMPRSGHPDSGGCQLFICHSRAPHLDAAYTAFGQVVEGLEVIDRIDVDSKILHVRVEGAR